MDAFRYGFGCGGEGLPKPIRIVIEQIFTLDLFHFYIVFLSDYSCTTVATVLYSFTFIVVQIEIVDRGVEGVWTIVEGNVVDSQAFVWSCGTVNADGRN